MPGVGLVRRKEVVVLQCRHVLRMNQHNYAGDQHRHHRHHRSVNHHFDRGNMRLSAAKNPSRDTHRARRSITFLQTARVDASKTKARNYRALEAGSLNAAIAYRTSILAYYSNPSKYGYRRTEKRLRKTNSLRCARHSRAFQFRTALSWPLEGADSIHAQIERTVIITAQGGQAGARVRNECAVHGWETRGRWNFANPLRPVPYPRFVSHEGLSVNGHYTFVDCHSRTRNWTRSTRTQK